MPQVISIPVQTTGGAGAAGGSATKFLGSLRKIVAVDIDYDAAAPATTDVTVAVGNQTILTRADSNTDAVIYPRRPAKDAAGADIAGAFSEVWARGPVTITVAQSNALNPAVTVRLVVE